MTLDEAFAALTALDAGVTSLGEAAGTEVRMAAVQVCDLCGDIASFDAKTTDGPWAYLCDTHFSAVGVGLGLGRGQRLIYQGVQEAPSAPQSVAPGDNGHEDSPRDSGAPQAKP